MSKEATKAGPTRPENKGVCVGLTTLSVKKDQVTKASTTTKQNIHLGKEGSPSRRLMMQCSKGPTGLEWPEQPRTECDGEGS